MADLVLEFIDKLKGLGPACARCLERNVPNANP